MRLLRLLVSVSLRLNRFVIVLSSHLNLSLCGTLLVSAEAIVEGIQLERVAGLAISHLGHASLETHHAVTNALLNRIFLNRVCLGVNLDCEQVLALLQVIMDRILEAMVVVIDKLELCAENLCFCLIPDSRESISHDGNNHVEDEEQSKKGANEEDEPEQEDLFCVLHETYCNIKVTQSKPVRVD